MARAGTASSTTPPSSRPATRLSTTRSRSYAARRGEWYADLVGSFVVTDTDLPAVRRRRAAVGRASPAAQVPSPARSGSLPARAIRVAGLEIALRDLDDLAGNARRIDAAVRAPPSSTMDPVFIELPAAAPPAAGWPPPTRSRPAGYRLKFRLGGVERDLFPELRHGRRLDRRGARPGDSRSSAPPGLHRAVRHRDPETGWRAPRLPQRAGRDGRGRLWTAVGRTTRPTPSSRRDGAELLGLATSRPGQRPPVVHLVRLLLGHRAPRRPDRPRTLLEAPQ